MIHFAPILSPFLDQSWSGENLLPFPAVPAHKFFSRGNHVKRFIVFDSGHNGELLASRLLFREVE